MYTLEISKVAQKEMALYKKSNPAAFAKDRLIYDVLDDIVKVLVLTAKGHYRDK